MWEGHCALPLFPRKQETKLTWKVPPPQPSRRMEGLLLTERGNSGRGRCISKFYFFINLLLLSPNPQIITNNCLFVYKGPETSWFGHFLGAIPMGTYVWNEMFIFLLLQLTSSWWLDQPRERRRVEEKFFLPSNISTKGKKRWKRITWTLWETQFPAQPHNRATSEAAFSAYTEYICTTWKQGQPWSCWWTKSKGGRKRMCWAWNLSLSFSVHCWKQYLPNS